MYLLGHWLALLLVQNASIYYHAAAGFPPKETFLDINCAGNYATWLGLMAQLINKHFPNSNERKKGHMKEQRQGV